MILLSERDALVGLATSVVKDSVSTGQLVPRLPAGQRSAVVSTLMRCMVHPETRDIYASAVQAALTQLSLFPFADDVLVPEYPEALIHEQGFEPLSDEELAWIAIDSDAIRAIQSGLALGVEGPDGEPLLTGPWYWDILTEVATDLPIRTTRQEASDANNTSTATPLAVPSSVVAEQSRGAQSDRDRRRRRWRPVIIAALVLVVMALTAGGTYASVLHFQKRNRSSEVLSLVASAREYIKELKREEAIRVFGQANNLAGHPISDEARAALQSVRTEFELLKSLSDLYIDSNRVWLDHAGIKKVSESYLEFFTEAGVLGGGRDVNEQAAAIRARPEVASYLVAAIDHWLNVLYLLPAPRNLAEEAERRQLVTLMKSLQQTAVAADDGTPSKQLRQFVADGNLKKLIEFFDANKSNGLHPETVGQLTGFLNMNGRRDVAVLLARDAWWNYPGNATIAGVLFSLSDLPTDKVLFAAIQTASDPENPVFWFNLAAAHAANNNPEAAAFARGKAEKAADKLKIKLPNQP